MQLALLTITANTHTRPSGRNILTNAGHNLGDKKAAFNTLEAFFQQTIAKEKYPRFDYSIQEDANGASVKLKTSKRHLQEVIIWEAESSDKDFRDEKFVAKELNISNKKSVELSVDYPTKGYKAFLVMVKYKHPNGKEPYNISTRMFTADNKELFEEIYEP